MIGHPNDIDLFKQVCKNLCHMNGSNFSFSLSYSAEWKMVQFEKDTKGAERERKKKKVYQSSKAGSCDWFPFTPTCLLTGFLPLQVVKALLRWFLLSDLHIRFIVPICRRLVQSQRNSCHVFIEPFTWRLFSTAIGALVVGGVSDVWCSIPEIGLSVQNRGERIIRYSNIIRILEAEY